MPALNESQWQHCRAVRSVLDARMQACGGWLAFDEYLDCVLYAPGLGYYSAGAVKIGAAGDFITAPELSPLFGACVARHCAPVLRSANERERPAGELLELGAGTGALAEALLIKLAELDALPEHYSILEVSADLSARQRQRLLALPKALAARVRWLDALPQQPIRGVIIANEVADALPFNCFEVKADGFAERGVAVHGEGNLCWSERPASVSLNKELERITAALPQPLPVGYRGELCLRLHPWLSSLADRLEWGGLLLFDYGLGRGELYHPQRIQGTLRCHYRHRAHDDPFLYPGLQDITAWVDFTRAAETADQSGLVISGYCTQAAYLLAAGIDEEIEPGVYSDAETHRDAHGNAVSRARRASEARQLLMPGEMGETFKALWLTRGNSEPAAAFSLQDLRRLL